MTKNSFNTKSTLSLNEQNYSFYDLNKLPHQDKVKTLPYCIKVLLENALRKEDGVSVTKQDIDRIIHWGANDIPEHQIAFSPSRVLLQDFTGVPAIVDLASMRDAIDQLGGDAEKINPLVPVDLVIDHSVMVDHFGKPDSLEKNIKLEFERNEERYKFLRWGQSAFSNFRVVPPGTGIVHQVNLEYLGEVVMQSHDGEETLVYPDTLVGTDSHTTMINGLGILGWGVGGIEAEAAMLGQAISMLLPEVVGFELTGELKEGATATDLVLSVTEKLRERGVVGKFVEFFGDGLAKLPLADRATIANMAPEYGATCGIFPVDGQTLDYLGLSGRKSSQIELVEAYAKRNGLWRNDGEEKARYSDELQLKLEDVEPSIAGPKRPQDRISLSASKQAFIDHMQLQGIDLSNENLSRFADEGGSTAVGKSQASVAEPIEVRGKSYNLKHGDLVLAAITSCTNTSNPAVMIAAGLVAKNAQEKGLKVKPWVKTSLAPGSQVVPAYLEKAGVLSALQQSGFELVGFGCTTCIGNSGPLPDEISEAINKGKLTVSSVLSGNRNFEGRIHQDIRANYLASPPLVVAYAFAGTMLLDLNTEALGTNAQGDSIYLKDIWPSQKQINDLVHKALSADMFSDKYANVFDGTEQWQSLPIPTGKIYDWPDSSYVKSPPYFDGMSIDVDELPTISEARCLVKVGDSITTDHISPAGAIQENSPVGQYLNEHGVPVDEFNSLGSRRGNHEVMMRGTFANTRLRNQLAPDTEGGYTTYLPNNEVTDIYSAAMRYKEHNTPLVVLAGKEYGTGSSRDWAAKGTKLLGVQVVIAQSYERIHRSNLVGFGVLPLEFKDGDSAESLGLDGTEQFTISSLEGKPKMVTASANRDGKKITFELKVRIDTQNEWDYYQHGGILHYVLRRLA